MKVTKKQLIFLYKNDTCDEWRAVIKQYASKFTILDDDDSFVEIEQKHLDLIISECSDNQLDLLKQCNITLGDNNLAIPDELRSISKLEEHLGEVNKILFPDMYERIQLLKGATGRSNRSDRYRALYLMGTWEIIDKGSYTVAIPLKK